MKYGQKHGIDTPVNRFLVDMVHFLENKPGSLMGIGYARPQAGIPGGCYLKRLSASKEFFSPVITMPPSAPAATKV